MAGDPNAVRNVALVGAGGAGKTTLVEALLHKAKVTNRRGSIDEKNTVTDWDDDEKERQQSILASPVHLPWDGKTLNLIDAPGALDFIAETACALNAVETALICVNAHDGVSVATRRHFRLARDLGLACVVVVTRVNGENIQPDELYTSIQKAIGERAVPVNMPNEFGHDVSSVHDIFAEDLPEGLQDQAAEFVQQATDRVVECDDALLEKYFETGEISKAELADAFPRALRQGNIVPIMHVAVDNDIGVNQLLNFISKDCPHGCRRNGELIRPAVGADGEDVAVQAETGPFSAQVWKVQIDPHVGKLAFLRVWSGELAAKTQFVVARTGNTERIGDFLYMQGKEGKPVAKAAAGDLVAVAKVEDLRIGDTVTDGSANFTLKPIAAPEPKVMLAIEPKNRNDEAKMGPELTKLNESDVGFKAERNNATNEMVVYGMSTLHLQIVLGRLARKKVETVTRTPRVPYLETVMGNGDGRHRHKKQSGGRGQFAEVHLRVAPRERGSGFEFVDEIVGGSIPRNFIPAVEKGINEQLEKGVIAGYPFVDVAATVYDGKFHDVDSDEFSFKLAAAAAFRAAVENARPSLLEPIMEVEIEIPSRFMGDISGDLNSRRGRIQGMEQDQDHAHIKAQVPLSEILNYSTELRSITAGEGDYSFKLSHYEPVPAHLASDVISKSKEPAHA